MSKTEKAPKIKSVLTANDEIEYQSDYLGDAERLAKRYGYTVKIEKVARTGIAFVHCARVRLAPRKGTHTHEKLEFSKTVKIPTLPNIDRALGELLEYLRREDERIQVVRQQREDVRGGKKLRLLVKLVK